ncbi:hypothetical protein, partial [Paenibacillus riograndensis]|uniref:hypothetical protein n=1 Tax=Paenibacillus riograndensis TaxID=483937 RepID=UPI0005856F4F
GPGTGVQLTGNGTVGGVVGVKDGAAGSMPLAKAASASNIYDIDQAEAAGIGLSAAEGSLQAKIGGIAGRASDAAMNGLLFSGSVQSAGEANMAGGG